MPKVTHEQAYSRKSSLKYTQSYTNLKLLNKRKSTQQLQGLDSPLKSQRLTGQLLADKVIPWRLKLQELFFLFPKRSCSCFARELGGKGGLQHSHSWSLGQRKQSLPRRGRQWTAAESENNDVAHKHTKTHAYIHPTASFVNESTQARLGQTFIFKFCPLR